MNEDTSIESIFKPSPFGLIPSDWDLKKISKLTKTTAGGTPSTSVSEYWGGNIKWMNSGELNLKRIQDVEGRITEVGLKNSSTKLIPPKCILIGLAGQGKTRGTVAMNMIELCTNQSIAAIYPSFLFNEDYLYYNLDFRYNELRQLSTGDGGRGGLNLNLINSIYIPLPEIPEQKAIASLLNTWDKSINNVQLTIDNLELRKKWLMQMLLTGKKRLNHDSLDSGIKGLNAGNEIRESFNQGNQGEGRKGADNWKEVRLGEIGDFFKGSGVSKVELVKDGFPCVRYGEIYTTHNIKIEKFSSFINESSAKLSKRIYKDDILFAGSGETKEDIGKCVVFLGDQEAYAGGDLIILRLKRKVESLFLSYLLNSEPLIRQKSSMGKGHSVVHIYAKDLANITINIPSAEEQTIIATVISSSDKEIELLRQKLDKLKEQKKGLMQVLLTGRKRLII